MRRLLKFAGYAVTGLVALLLVVLVVVYQASGSRLRRTHLVVARPVHIPGEAAAIERGRHLAATRGCLDCHGADLGGAKVIEDSAMGRLYGPNLTKGRGGLPGSYTDGDYVKAIRHGVALDGHGLFLMPSAEYSHLGDDDLGALIAYLKSVPPVDRDRVPLAVGPVARVLLLAGKLKIAADEIDHANLRPASVQPGVTVEYGRYLAVGCTGCHGANYSGGKIDIGPPDWPHAANLTPHADGRLAKWTEDDFLKVLRTARRPDGTEVNPVMPRNFGQMNDVELKAIWLFLRTLPPVPTGSR
jgi:cytochrome c553